MSDLQDHLNRVMAELEALPPMRPTSCAQCPWRRESAPGFLGPHSAEDWVEQAHRDGPIACHLTIFDSDINGEGDWTDPRILQCHGAAQYRRNVAKKPLFEKVAVCDETDTVGHFATPNEFITHHTRRWPERSN